jgi:hypothetical protein
VIICAQCGSAVELGATFCGSCGTPAPKAQPPAGGYGAVPAQPPAAGYGAAPAQPPLGGTAEGTCATHPTVRAVGTCVRCGTFFCGECMPERERGVRRCNDCQAKLSRLPWDDRESLGLLRAWWQTCMKMIASPVETLRTAEPAAPLGSSLLFAVLCALAGYLATIVLYGLGIGGVMLAAAAKGEGFGKMGVVGGIGIGIGVSVFYLLLLAGFSMLSVLFWAGLEHFTLGLLGGPRGSYAVSVRAQAMGMGVYVIGFIPLCSLYVFPIWSIVVRIFAMQNLHRTTGGRAVGAVLIPAGILIFCLVSAYAVMIGTMIASGR